MLSLLFQFIRFAGIGFLNTGVAFAIFNFLTFYFDIFTGYTAGFFTVVAFLIAVSHSYFWNRYLVFGRSAALGIAASLSRFVVAGILGAVVIVAAGFGAAKQYEYPFYLGLLAALVIGEIVFWHVFQIGRNTLMPGSRRDFSYFIAITAVGAFIQFFVTSLITSHVPPQFGLPQGLWTYLANALATAISLVWNFAGYKIIVFKNK